jgi:hypothetical protein
VPKSQWKVSSTSTPRTMRWVGTWSHFLFPSGYILVNTIERGAFTVKLAKGRGAGKGPGFGGKSKGKGRY